MLIDWRDVLLTLAEITIAIIGFSGIVGALGRDESRSRSSDEYVLFRWMLDYSLAALLNALIPFLVFATGVGESMGWRISSIVWLVGWIVYSILARAYLGEMYKRSTPLDRSFHVGDYLVVAVVVLNAVGWPFAPGFLPYFIAVLWFIGGAIVGFVRLIGLQWRAIGS